MNNENIRQGILFLLQYENEESPCKDGYTFLEIRDFLKLNNNGIDHKELKGILTGMEDHKLIEERHFGNEFSGRVDYSNEPLGIGIVEDSINELKEKWKIE